MQFFKKTHSVFPSYKEIYKKIKGKQRQQQETKLNKVMNKIQKLKSTVNLNEEHRKLAKKLIDDYKREPLYEKPPHEEISDLAVIENAKPSKYASSLNQYLENSEEEQNNYEEHLKFRKKALQRELDHDEEEQLRSTKCKKNKGNFDEEELFYRKLFDNTHNTHHKENQHKEKQTRNANMIENKKKLTQIYLPYVQALANTNIVKWRILNS